MNNPEALVNPQVLTWARETAGYAIDAVVAELAEPEVSATTIKAWERGEAKPRYSQFEKLTDIYNRSEMLFYCKEPPVDDTLERLGSLPRQIKERLPTKMRFLLREARLRQLYIEKLLPDRELRPIPCKGMANLDADITEIAKTVREQLDISVVEQKRWPDARGALRHWRAALEEEGIWIFFAPFAEDDYDGFYFEDKQYPVIFLNSRKSYEQQIFTLFHELGHVLLAKGGLLAVGEMQLELTGDFLQIERFCSAFATEMLLPEAEVQLTTMPDEDKLQQLATEYKVSQELILRKCRDQGLIEDARFNELLTQWQQDTKPAPLPAKAGVRCECFGYRFTNMVFAAFHRGKLTDFELTEIFNISVDKLEQLELRASEAIA